MESPKSRHGSLLVVFLAVFIDLLGFGLVLPLLPLYGKTLAEHYGMNTAQTGWTVGLLLSSFSAMQFLFSPVWGRLSDRFGRRPILMVGLLGSVVCYTGFGLATWWQSLWGMFASRIGAGIAGATIATAQAYIADTTGKHERTKGMALIGAAFALGFTLGPLLGAAALWLGGGDFTTSPWPGFVAAMLSAGALLLAAFLLPESHAGRGGGGEHPHLVYRGGWHLIWSTPSLGPLLVAVFITICSFANFESTLSLQIARMGGEAAAGTAEAAGRNDAAAADATAAAAQEAAAERSRLLLVLFCFAYLGLILALAQGVLVRRLAGRIADETLAQVGAAVAIVAFLALVWATRLNSIGLLCVTMAIEVIGFSLVSPSLQSLISRRTTPAQQGLALGMAQSGSSLARIAGPVMGVRLFAKAATWPYFGAAGLMSVGLLLTMWAVRRGRDYA